MAHTNSTTNYGLPQFIGTDKPGWLTDVNSAYTAIDTQMKTNADGVASNLASINANKTTYDNFVTEQNNQNSNVNSQLASLSSKYDTAISGIQWNPLESASYSINSVEVEISGTPYTAQTTDGRYLYINAIIEMENKLTNSSSLTLQINPKTPLIVKPTKEYNAGFVAKLYRKPFISFKPTDGSDGEQKFSCYNLALPDLVRQYPYTTDLHTFITTAGTVAFTFVLPKAGSDKYYTLNMGSLEITTGEYDKPVIVIHDIIPLPFAKGDM